MTDQELPKKFKIPSHHRWLEKGIKLTGSQAELARKLAESADVRCYPQKVNEWRIRGIIPPYWVRHLAAVLNVDPSHIDQLLYPSAANLSGEAAQQE